MNDLPYEVCYGSEYNFSSCMLEILEFSQNFNVHVELLEIAFHLHYLNQFNSGTIFSFRNTILFVNKQDFVYHIHKGVEVCNEI